MGLIPPFLSGFSFRVLKSYISLIKAKYGLNLPILSIILAVRIHPQHLVADKK
jgi:hypothetical protein